MEDKLYWYAAKIIKTVDGDTLDIELALGINVYIRERVRLYGVNTPETFGVKRGSDEYKRGMEAKRFVQSFLKDRKCVVKTIKDKTGKYGRLLALVYVGELCLNEELVKNGLAEERYY